MARTDAAGTESRRRPLHRGVRPLQVHSLAPDGAGPPFFIVSSGSVVEFVGGAIVNAANCGTCHGWLLIDAPSGPRFGCGCHGSVLWPHGQCGVCVLAGSCCWVIVALQYSTRMTHCMVPTPHTRGALLDYGSCAMCVGALQVAWAGVVLTAPLRVLVAVAWPRLEERFPVTARDGASPQDPPA